MELILRGVAVGALAATAAGFWGSGGRLPVRLAGALFCLAIIGYAFNSSADARAATQPFAIPLDILAMGGIGLFHLFAATLFEDRPLTLAGFAPAAALLVVGLAGR